MINNTGKTICPYCGVGCGVVVAEQDGQLVLTGDKSHPANYGRLCSKGSALLDTIGLQGRLLSPQIGQKTASWEQAIQTVASTFQATIKKHGKDAIAFYVSGQLLTEDYYLANKLMKGYIGSANIDTNSRLCMSSAVAGYKRAFGSDTVPVSYADVEGADCLIFAGSNAAWTHPVLYQRIIAAKEKNPNLTLIVIDPRRTATAQTADIYLAIKPATDGYLFNGLLNFLDLNQHLDLDFLATVDGVLPALNAVKKNYSVDAVARICGLTPELLTNFYQTFADTPKTVVLYSQGINQSSSGVDKINAIINCCLATGRVGKPYCGPFSLTGQPNAMGGREVGGLANQLAAHMDFDPEDVAKVQRFWGSPTIATKPGVKATELVDAINDGQIKALWIMATNPIFSLPDSLQVRKALSKCDFVVLSECMQQTDTTPYADVLLPATTWGENEGMVTNSERVISKRNAFLAAPGEAKADWKIVQLVAQKMGFSGFDYQTPRAVFDEYSKLTAFENAGNRDLDLSQYSNLSEQQYQQFQPQRWGDNLFKDGRFFSKTKRAFMPIIEARMPLSSSNYDYPLNLNTGRVRDQWHSMTRTGKSTKLGQHKPEPTLSIHPKIALQKGFKDRHLVTLRSAYGATVVRLEFDLSQKENEVFFPFHWGSNNSSHGQINTLVNPHTDPLSGQPEFKQTPVNISHFKAQWYGYLLSSEPINTLTTCYQVYSKGVGFYRYELADDKPLIDVEVWAKEVLAGLSEPAHWLSFSDKKHGRHRFALIHEQKLLACLFVSSQPELPDPAWIGQLFGQPLTSIKRIDILAGKPAEASADKGRIICTCFNVGINEIKNLIAKGDISTVAQIGSKLQAGTNCGSCIPELKQLL